MSNALKLMRPIFEKLEKEADEKRNQHGYHQRLIRNLNDKSDRILRGDYRTIHQSITDENYGLGIMTNKISIVSTTDGDWYGLFVNGKVVFQGHSIPQHEMLDVLSKNQPFESENFEVDSEWLDGSGEFSEDFSDIPKEMFVED